MDWNKIHIKRETIKTYNAVYVARKSPSKRHHLTNDVKNLALICGNNHNNPNDYQLINYVYLNDNPLPLEEVCKKINQSYVGLMLSETEGACFSSSEYLLCGIPIISTKSFGGREFWYNDHNSIIVEPDPKKIAQAVEDTINHYNKYDKLKIRNDHIEKQKILRNKFIKKLKELFSEHNVKVDARKYFEDNFYHKLRKSEGRMDTMKNIWN